MIQTHPEVPESQGCQEMFCFFRFFQLVQGNPLPGGNPGGKAGIGGFIVGKQPGLFGQPADFLLGQAAQPQRRLYLQFPQGLNPRTVCIIVRCVGAVQNQGKTIGLSRLQNPGKQRPLAEIAPVCRVGGNLLPAQHIHGESHHFHTQLPGKVLGVFILKLGLKGGFHIIGPDICAALHSGVQ